MPGEFKQSASPFSQNAHAMRIVYHQPRSMPLGEHSEFSHRGQVTIHTENTITCDQTVIQFSSGQFRLKLPSVQMPIPLQPSPGKTRTVQQGRMIQPILEHDIPTPHQGGYDTQIGHVAGGKQQRPVTTHKGGQLFLQSLMRTAMTTNQMCGSGSHPKLGGTPLQRINDGWMTGQPQIIIAAEIDQSTTFN